MLENFKSYGGVKEIGPFHKCFSSVVGPNGSGKSNVIDALLFVFGKRAKKLRLNKVSELIHSSDSVRKNPPAYARVSVYFQEIVDTGDGDNDYDVVPNTEHSVTRIARKDNSSTYQLDGKNCAFRDVARYLDSKGIDLDNNRFLILQGEVEMISMMAPKGKNENDEGLLEYLEDIIGSNKFVDQTNEAAAKVETLSDVRQERLNRVKAVEKEMESLEGAKLEAEALLQKEREIRRKKNVLYQLKKAKASRSATKAEEETVTLKESLAAERERLAAADTRIQEIESGMSVQKSEYDKIHNELIRTKEEFTAYERKDIMLREEMKHCKAQRKKLEAKVKAETKKESAAVQAGEDATASIPDLEDAIETLTEKKSKEDEKLETIYDDIKDVTDQLRVEVEAKSQELAPVNEERVTFQAELDTAMTEMNLLKDTTSRAEQQLQSVESELAGLDASQAAKQQELHDCEQELAASTKRIDESKQECERLAQQETALSKRSKEIMVSGRERERERERELCCIAQAVCQYR